MKIKHNQPFLDNIDAEIAKKVIISNKLVNGKYTKLFEEKIANRHNLSEENVACLSSGYAALVLSSKLIFKKNSKVLIPNYGCRSIFQSLKFNKLNAKIIDNEKLKHNASLDRIKKSNIKNLIYPHYFGIPTNINSLKKKKNNRRLFAIFWSKIIQ